MAISNISYMYLLSALAYSFIQLMNTVTGTEIQVRHPAIHLNFSDLLQPKPSVLLFVTVHLADVELQNLDFPMVLAGPETTSNNDSWGSTVTSRELGVSLARRIRTLTSLIVLKPDQDLNPVIEKGVLPAYFSIWFRMRDPSILAPNVQPKTAIILVPDAPTDEPRPINSWLNIGQVGYYLIYTIFLTTKTPSGSQPQLMARKTCLLCPTCSEDVEFIRYSTPRNDFRPCKQMEMLQSYLFSRQALTWTWNHIVSFDYLFTTKTQEQHNSMQQYFFKEGSLLHAVTQCLTDGLNVTMHNPQFMQRYGRGPFDIQISTKIMLPSDYVFVTEVSTSQEASGLAFYVENFELKLWLAIGTAVLLSGVLHATHHVMSQLGDGGRERLFQTFISSFTGNCCQIIKLLIDQSASDSWLLLLGKIMPWAGWILLWLKLIWILASIILSNAYKSKISSKWVVNFPFETELQEWHQFENFSLYNIDGGSEDCATSGAEHRDERQMNDLTTAQFNRFVQYEVTRNGIHGQEFGGTVTGSRLRTPYFYRISGSAKKNHSRGHSTAGDFVWRVFYRVAYLKFICTRRKEVSGVALVERSVKKYCHSVNGKWDSLQRILRRLNPICARDLRNYVGLTYSTKVSRYAAHREEYLKHLREKVTGGGEELIQFDKESSENLYWLSRRPKTAFVIPKMDFPVYWNLFKKLMREDKSLKFAHTGKRSLRKIDKGDWGLFATLNTHAYFRPAEAEPMRRRVQGLETSGLVDFLVKLHRILMPVLNETRHDQIAEVTSDSVPLSMDDASTSIVFYLLIVGCSLATVCFLVELFVTYVVIPNTLMVMVLLEVVAMLR